MFLLLLSFLDNSSITIDLSASYSVWSSPGLLSFSSTSFTSLILTISSDKSSRLIGLLVYISPRIFVPTVFCSFLTQHIIRSFLDFTQITVKEFYLIKPTFSVLLLFLDSLSLNKFRETVSSLNSLSS